MTPSSKIVDELIGYDVKGLAFFYFSYRAPEPQDDRNLMSSLLVQLVRCLSRIDSKAKESVRYFVPTGFYTLCERHYPS